MTQLIPQQKIDGAAEKSSLKTIKDLPTKDMRSEMSAMEWSCWFEDEFKSGVQFALNEIEPLMVECLDWLNVSQLYEDYANVNSKMILEEFINYRTMKELEKLLEFESE